MWRSSQVGAAQHPNWEASGTKSCPLPPSTARYDAESCHQGSVPVYAVNVGSIRQVEETVRFAARRFLRLVVKSSGHDYAGRSSVRGSLSIWTHNLKSVEFVDDFVEEGCGSSAGSAVVIGAGVQWRELYTAAHAKSKLVVGGLSASVSAAGGYVQGGGHSPLSPTYGLAADNALQFAVVTHNGTAVYANRCVNKDLFWALRGGGGGTFGVVTAAVYRTFPAAENILSAVHVVSASDDKSYRELLGEFTSASVALSDQGWAGYFVMEGTAIVLRYLAINRSVEYHDESFAPLLEWIGERNATIRVVGSDTRSYPSFLAWYNDTMCGFYPSSNGGGCEDAVGTDRVIASRLVPRWAIANSSQAIADALLALLRSNATSNEILGIAVGGGAASVPQDNAVNPVWRETLWHITVESSWQSDAIEELGSVSARMSRLSAANQELRDLTPGSGAYFNEADYLEPDWQQSLFGENYAKLLALKRQFDPPGLFVCWHCVGSEHWSTDLDCAA